MTTNSSLLRRRLDRAETAMGTATVSRRNDHGPWVLSHAQEHLWLLQQLSDAPGEFNRCMTVQFDGPLKTPVLRDALSEVIARHEILRTRISDVDGGPRLVVASPTPVALPLVDLRKRKQSKRKTEQAACRQMRSETSRPFDLERGPLFRVILYRLSEEWHLLHIVLHHIVSDGWSDGVLLRDLAASYRARTGDEPIERGDLPVQYGDFAQWERSEQEKKSERQRSYWRNAFEDAPPELRLPFDHCPTQRTAYDGRKVVTVIAPPLADDIKRVAQRNNATLFMVLLSAFQSLLLRYCGEDDIVVGTPIATRSLPESRDLIGLFLNTLPIRTDLSDDPPFSELVTRVRTQTLAAFAHHEFPFSEIVKLFHRRHQTQRPLLRTMMQLRNMPQYEATFGSVQACWFDLDEKDPTGARLRLAPMARLDLALDCVERSGTIVCCFEYNATVLEKDTVTRLASHFERLLTGVARDDSVRLGDLPLMSEAEIEDLVDTWMVGQNEWAEAPRVHEMFEAQVRATPNAVAIEDRTNTLTYAVLDDRANGVAARLGSLGVGPGDVVAVCIPRSIDMVVGLLGVLKSGAGYLPIDPDYPSRRVEFMLEDARPTVVITVSSVRVPCGRGKVRAWARVNVDDLDPFDEPVVQARIPDAHDIAYVIYTSGSTGEPKGVVVGHHALTNYVRCALDAYELGIADRVLQFASVSFDASVEEIFPTLASGATLVLRDDDMISSPAIFLAACVSLDISVLNLPTAYWHEMTLGVSGQACLPDSLRLVIIGGEAASAGVLEAWRERLGNDILVMNTYGPTEATVVTTMCEVLGPDATEVIDRNVPIGRPVTNTSVYVLDGQRRPQPTGALGELYVSGAGVARGYLGRPALTAERFVRDPFRPHCDAIMYRTGDVGRYRADGVLEFRGRIDDQVKVRGHRIELGEIETVLSGHAEVEAVVAVLRADDTGDHQLVAYVVPSPGSAVTVRVLRAYLESRLPEYMIPQRFAHAAQLPLNRSGKIDRGALPDPAAHPLDTGAEHVQLETPTQHAIGEIFRELLDADRIGAHDDFFELGGQSLLATRLLSRLREHFDVPLLLRDVFENGTVARLAECVDARSPGSDALQPVTPVFHNGRAPLSFAQRRVWYLDQLQPNSPAYNIPFAVKLTGALDVRALEQSLAEILRRHEVLRSQFVLSDNAPVQIVDPTVRVQLCVTDLTANTHPEQEARRLLARDAGQPFDLSAGPVFRTRLVRIADHTHILAIVVHHIAADGWSFEVLLRELGLLYQAFSSGRRSPLAKPVLQYTDYAVWQSRLPATASYQSQLAYWVSKLGGDLPTVDLPTDRPRPAVQTYSGATVSFDCPVDMCNRLKAAGTAHDATLFMVLFAAFNYLLHRYTGQDDLTVGTPIANRNRPEIEDIIGYFANTLVLRTNLEGTETFADVVGRVRSVCLDAYDHQDFPFEQIVEELRPTRDLSRTPLFQIMFVYQEATTRRNRIGSVRADRFDIPTSVARTDLYLWIQRTRAGLRGIIEYNTDIFDSKTVRRMAEHYQRVLEVVSGGIDVPLAQLRILSETERNQLLFQWNDTDAPFEACLVHELIQRQAAVHPDRIAVQCGDQSITYRDLNTRADCLARYLVTLGIQPDYLVGVAVSRSIDMVVALLGVLKSGAAYLPLDADYPSSRLKFMIQDSGVEVILTDTLFRERIADAALPEHGQRTVHLICLDTEWSAIENCDTHRLDVQHDNANLAYVIYTSGSTGTPKGVEIQHDSVVNFLESMCREPGLDDHDVLFAVTTLSFDIAVLELLLPLIVGARVVIATPGDLRDGAVLARAIADAGTTVMQATPATWRALLAANWEPATPIKVLCGGEALPWDLAAALLNRVGELWNMYGPTETTVWSTCQRVTNADVISIGRPIANTRAYVLDRRLQPVPFGVPGELYIAGAGVARGYRGRPDLTAGKFIRDPFAAAEDARMYRTGDIARRRSDGSLECMGRIDHQVKVRGFRIELGEIETALAAHAAVAQCVAAVREVRTGDVRLVAYVVHGAGKTVTSSELRRHLREMVPSFMIPQHVVALDELPLTANGKVDRTKLPAPFDVIPRTTEYVEPQGETEQRIATLWKEALGVERVSRHANFFELGGHSLLSMTVIARIAADLGPHLNPRVMVLQTLAQIAAECDRQRSNDLQQRAVPTWLRRVADRIHKLVRSQ